jgi:hypothetical protein
VINLKIDLESINKQLKHVKVDKSYYIIQAIDVIYKKHRIARFFHSLHGGYKMKLLTNKRSEYDYEEYEIFEELSLIMKALKSLK